MVRFRLFFPVQYIHEMYIMMALLVFPCLCHSVKTVKNVNPLPHTPYSSFVAVRVICDQDEAARVLSGVLLCRD